MDGRPLSPVDGKGRDTGEDPGLRHSDHRLGVSDFPSFSLTRGLRSTGLCSGLNPVGWVLTEPVVFDHYPLNLPGLLRGASPVCPGSRSPGSV